MAYLLGLSRRRSRYHFRCRLPAALVARIGRRELGRSLQTADCRIARKGWCRLIIMTAELWTAVQQAVEQQEIDRLVAVGYPRGSTRTGARGSRPISRRILA